MHVKNLPCGQASYNLKCQAYNCHLPTRVSWDSDMFKYSLFLPKIQFRSISTARGYYEILKVVPTASTEEIKASYYELSKKYHPDLNPGNTEAEKNFKDLSEAYETLSNPTKRKAYDSEFNLYQTFHRTVSDDPKDFVDPTKYPKWSKQNSRPNVDPRTFNHFNFQQWEREHYQNQLRWKRVGQYKSAYHTKKIYSWDVNKRYDFLSILWLIWFTTLFYYTSEVGENKKVMVRDSDDDDIILVYDVKK